jgi:hypothetical protein
LRLPAAERWLLVKAALLLGSIRLGLRLLTFQVLRRFLDKLTEVPLGLREADRFSAEKIAWAVELASRCMPVGMGCLPQALTAQLLLARRGYPTLLHIGVARKDEGEFVAHAWLESDGKVVIGGHELKRYAPLVALKGKA